MSAATTSNPTANLIPIEMEGITPIIKSHHNAPLIIPYIYVTHYK